MAEEALKIRVTGRVQGVGFRWSTKAVADQLHIRGDVANQADGSVIIHAVADHAAMTAFAQTIKQGPNKFVQVSTYEATPLASTPKYDGFAVVG
ncbi:acylphosphatase [Lacticaseibacillus sharpeae]|uniref:acylphosphatase n=1 Tax=Lacticaseibacillus sharpeae JCM 1186 = DSM 20505 TaxID=1291052 RepID=A0A0R1ZPM0_9LACO|nr:acylphosphatase [Lacticaseibacillus sharpeae]KRM56394.1 hypothetical protein FC18_GL000078 [Lacticaseibacillus sharpeae JCM 1186 = DSM 20505]